MTRETASVVVRAKDKASTLGAAIASIRAQDVPAEVVVVDSGSTDGTLQLARRLADVVVEMEPGTFSYGRSLNLGASRAGGSIIFALSAHCVAPAPDWIRRSLRHYDDPSVAGTCGLRTNPDDSPLPAARLVTPADVLANPHWGFSNHASSWRRRAWSERPFDEDLPSCEDKEWMWTAMVRGWNFVADPDLYVDTPHRRGAGARALWRRVYLENRVIASILEYPEPGLPAALRSWWGYFPGESRYPRWVRRLNHLRAVERAAAYAGARAGASERNARTIRLGGGRDAHPAGARYRSDRTQ